MIPTFNEFLMKTSGPRNSYVKEPGFESLYVRRTQRYINGEVRQVVDLANATASHPGKGAFTRLILRLVRDYPDLTIYAENVLNFRLFVMLTTKLGFQSDQTNPPSCYRLSSRKINLLRWF